MVVFANFSLADVILIVDAFHNCELDFKRRTAKIILINYPVCNGTQLEDRCLRSFVITNVSFFALQQHSTMEIVRRVRLVPIHLLLLPMMKATFVVDASSAAANRKKAASS